MIEAMSPKQAVAKKAVPKTRSEKPAARSTDRSRFLISLPELRARLETARLSKRQRELILHCLKWESPERATALWLEPGWKLTAAHFAASPSDTCAIVFAAPFVTAGPLVMNAFFDVFSQRDQQVVVFLEPVTCADFCTVPGSITVFAKGLTVKRLASFEGPDAHTNVGGAFAAPYVVADLAEGGVFLEPKTVATIGACAGQVSGLPRTVKLKRYDSLLAMCPSIPDDGDDTWALVANFIASGAKLAKPRVR